MARKCLDDEASRALDVLGGKRSPSPIVREFVEALNRDTVDYRVPGWDAIHAELIADLHLMQTLVRERAYCAKRGIPDGFKGIIFAPELKPDPDAKGGSITRVINATDIDGPLFGVYTDPQNGSTLVQANVKPDERNRAIQTYINCREALRLLWKSGEPQRVDFCVGACGRYVYMRRYCKYCLRNSTARVQVLRSDE